MIEVRAEREQYNDILMASVKTGCGAWQTVVDENGRPSDFTVEYQKSPSAPRTFEQLKAKLQKVGDL